MREKLRALTHTCFCSLPFSPASAHPGGIAQRTLPPKFPPPLRPLPWLRSLLLEKGPLGVLLPELEPPAHSSAVWRKCTSGPCCACNKTSGLTTFSGLLQDASVWIWKPWPLLHQDCRMAPDGPWASGPSGNFGRHGLSRRATASRMPSTADSPGTSGCRMTSAT